MTEEKLTLSTTEGHTITRYVCIQTCVMPGTKCPNKWQAFKLMTGSLLGCSIGVGVSLALNKTIAWGVLRDGKAKVWEVLK